MALWNQLSQKCSRKVFFPMLSAIVLRFDDFLFLVIQMKINIIFVWIFGENYFRILFFVFSALIIQLVHTIITSDSSMNLLITSPRLQSFSLISGVLTRLALHWSTVQPSTDPSDDPFHTVLHIHVLRRSLHNIQHRMTMSMSMVTALRTMTHPPLSTSRL